MSNEITSETLSALLTPIVVDELFKAVGVALSFSDIDPARQRQLVNQMAREIEKHGSPGLICSHATKKGEDRRL